MACRTRAAIAGASIPFPSRLGKPEEFADLVAYILGNAISTARPSASTAPRGAEVTDYGSRAERWVAQKWPAIRARGMWRFVLLKGVVVLGRADVRLPRHHDAGPVPLRITRCCSPLALPLCAIGGLCWGLLTWYFNERIYRALQTSR
jgi:hypothetical protein